MLKEANFLEGKELAEKVQYICIQTVSITYILLLYIFNIMANRYTDIYIANTTFHSKNMQYINTKVRYMLQLSVAENGYCMFEVNLKVRF